jgi:hypothetical protein
MRRLVVAMTMAVSGCGGSEPREGDEPSRRCERMRDHLVDLRLADATGIDREGSRALMRSALGDDFIDSCARTLTTEQIECALRAASAELAAACHRPSHR